MKRRDLERHLRAHGARPIREGARHVVWVKGELSSAVPRHRELKLFTAVAICEDLGLPRPRGSR